MSKTARRIFVGMALLGVAMFAAGCLSSSGEETCPCAALKDFWVQVEPHDGVDIERIQRIAEEAGLEFEQFGITLDPESPNIIYLRIVPQEVVGEGHQGKAYFSNLNDLHVNIVEKEMTYGDESIKVTFMHELAHVLGRKGGHLERPKVGIMNPIPAYIKGQGFSKDDIEFLCGPDQLESTTGVCARPLSGARVRARFWTP